MNLQVDIVQHFHFEDDTHGFAGEIYYDYDQFLGEFMNYGGNRRWSFQWSSPQSFLQFAGEAVKKHPIENSQDLASSIKEFILDILIEQEKEKKSAKTLRN